MTNKMVDDSDKILEDVAQNAGDRTAAINSNPKMALEEARNAAAGEGPTGSGGTAPSTAEEHIPSTSDSDATDLPSANAPDPKAANPKTNPNATTQKPAEESNDVNRS